MINTTNTYFCITINMLQNKKKQTTRAKTIVYFKGMSQGIIIQKISRDLSHPKDTM